MNLDERLREILREVSALDECHLEFREAKKAIKQALLECLPEESCVEELNEKGRIERYEEEWNEGYNACLSEIKKRIG